jgi:hypothetical protein
MATTQARPAIRHLSRTSQRVKRFVEHPFTKLTVGLILVTTSSVEIYHSFYDDLNHLRLRVHHGLLLLGFVNVLAAVPGLIEGLERFLNGREEIPTILRSKQEQEQAGV